MIVRRQTTRLEPAAGLVSALVDDTRRLAAVARPSPDAILEQLIDAGVLEAGINAAHEGGGEHPDAQTWRTVTLALGRAFVAATGRELRHAPAHLAHAALVAGFSGELPATVPLSPIQAFVQDAVYPQMYVAAARQVVQVRRPARAVVVGLGPAGAVLSAVVTAALEQQRVDCTTLLTRPRGPGSSEHVIGRPLREQIADPPDAVLLLVAAGTLAPFRTVLAELHAARLSDDRIVLLRAPGSTDLTPEDERHTLEGHAVFAVPFEGAVLARGLHGHTAGRLQDVSRGHWRALLPLEGHEPPTHPDHERRKYLTPPDVHGRVLLKFAGLGRVGRRRLARAERLAAAGFAPAPDALSNGFLALPWVEGSPLRPAEVGEAVARRVAGYLAWLRLNAARPDHAEPLALAAMLRENTLEALGPTAASAIARACDAAAGFSEQPAVDVDGRMFPHEWVQTARGLLKTDALEHHDDPYFPGSHDMAWDVAGAISESGLEGPAEMLLLDTYVRATGDAISERLPYYQLAYEAFRFGYDTLAARELAGTHDGWRFAARARERQVKLARYAARFT